MAAEEWTGDFNTTMIIIVTVVCFSWVPIVIMVSLYQHCRARSRSKKEGAKDAADVEKAPPRKPYVPMKQPVYVPMPVVTKPDRTASLRTFNSVSSWEPIRRDWRDSASISYEPPHPSPAGSIRSRSKQPAGRNSFQINNAFYDTTPLPENAPSIKAAAERSSRSSTEQRRSMEGGHGNTPQKHRTVSRNRSTPKVDSTADESLPEMPPLPRSALRTQPGPKLDSSDEGPPPMPTPPRFAARPLKGILVSRSDETPPQMPPAPRSVYRPQGNVTPASSPPDVEDEAASPPSSFAFENPAEVQGSSLHSQTYGPSPQDGAQDGARTPTAIERVHQGL
ncbi:hypothetical protein QBC39DRAFT_330386 [Podospora conica]|nr:hypothetical protein QBC39DRAFT_330386 [Schizothecium conicum]